MNRVGAMFGLFRKKTLLDSGIFQGFTDFHSHILPGVDDGICSTDDALSALDDYQTMGIREVVFTPHIMEDYSENNADSLKRHFAEFLQVYKGDIKLSLGAEYMLDGMFEKHLESGRLLTVIDRHVMVETSYMYAPMNFHELLDKIHDKGYHIILAHPERYEYMLPDDYTLLKQNQIKFQLNLLSLTGFYGKKAQFIAHRLLERNYYDFLGNDLHRLSAFRRESSKKVLTADMMGKIAKINNGRAI